MYFENVKIKFKLFFRDIDLPLSDNPCVVVQTIMFSEWQSVVWKSKMDVVSIFNFCFNSFNIL